MKESFLWTFSFSGIGQKKYFFNLKLQVYISIVLCCIVLYCFFIYNARKSRKNLILGFLEMPGLYQWRTITKIFIPVLDCFMSKTTTTTTNYKKLHGSLKCRFKKWVIEHFLLQVISRRKKLPHFLECHLK